MIFRSVLPVCEIFRTNQPKDSDSDMREVRYNSFCSNCHSGRDPEFNLFTFPNYCIGRTDGFDAPLCVRNAGSITLVW